MTPGLIRSIKENIDLHGKRISVWQHSGIRTNLTELPLLLLRVAKNEYFKNQLQSNQDNAKNTWKSINQLLRQNNKSSRRYIINVYKLLMLLIITSWKLSMFLQTMQTNYKKNYFGRSPNFSLYISSCSPSEVKTYIDSLK